MPPPIDTNRTKLADAFERLASTCRRIPFAMSERAMRERGGEALGRELVTSLGVRSPSVSLVGASGAGRGLAMGWGMRGGRTTSSLTFGPRLYGGGGGLGFALRW